MLHKRAHQRSTTSRRGGFTSFAGAKVRFFCELTKLFETFFKKRCIFASYTLYIIYARGKKVRKTADTRIIVTAVKVIAKGYSPKLFHQDWTLSRSFTLGIPQAIWLGLLSLNQDLDFVEVFHVRNTSNELGFALT